MPDVFISYSRKDGEFVNRLYDALIASGRTHEDIWVDWEDIPPSADWKSEVFNGIDSSHTFLFIISPDSVQSDICREEIDHAVRNKKRFVPVMHREITEDSHRVLMHPIISTHNWVMFRDDVDDFQTAFNTLIETIETDLNHVRIHTRILVQAREWDARGRDDNLLLIGSEIDNAVVWMKESDAEDKSPSVTDLQRAYISASHHNQRRRQQRRLLITGVVAVISILAVIAGLSTVVALNALNDVALGSTQVAYQAATADSARQTSDANANLAATNEREANIQADRAATSERDAVEQAETALFAATQASIAEATSKANEAIAVTARAEAERSADEVRGLLVIDAARRQLVDNPLLAIALAVEALDGLTDPPARIRRIASEVLYASGPSRIYEGHSNTIHAVAMNSDGTRALSAADDNLLILWDTDPDSETFGVPILNIPTTSRVNAIAFSPNGRLAVTGDRSGGVIVWDMDEESPTFGTILRRFESHRYRIITAVAFSPDGTYIATSAIDREIHIADVTTGDEVAVLTGHSGAITQVRFLSDRNRIISASDSGELLLWSVLRRQVVREFTGHTLGIVDFVIIGDGTGIVSAGCSEQRVLQVQGLETTQCIRSEILEFNVMTGAMTPFIDPVEGIIMTMAWSEGDRLLVIGFDNGMMRLIQTRTLLRTFTIHTGRIAGLAFGANGRRLVSAAADRRVILWDMQSGAIIERLSNHTDWVNDITYSSDGRMALSASDDATLILWNTDTESPGFGHAIRQFTGHTQWVLAVALSPDDSLAVSASYDGRVIVWDVATGARIRQFTGHSGVVNDVAFHPNGQWVISSGCQLVQQRCVGELLIWHVRTGEIVATLDYGNTSADGFAFTLTVSPDGRLLAVGGCAQLDEIQNCVNGLITLWDIVPDSATFGEVVMRLTAHSDFVTDIAFSPTGERMLTGSADGTLLYWNVATGAVIETLEGHSSSVTHVAFNPMIPEQAISSSLDATLIVWDLKTGDAVYTLIGHQREVLSVDFSPNGGQAISGAMDAQVIIWRVQSLQEIVSWARVNRASRELTCDERELYSLPLASHCEG